MSKTSRTPYKNNKKETCERCGKTEKKKKQVSGVATANSLDNCEQTVPS